MTKYRATFGILLASLLVQVILTLQPELLNFFCFNPASLSPLSLVQLFLYQVSHANWPHLIGNFSTGLPFMLFFEHQKGSKKTLEFYVICGVAAALFHGLLVGGGIIGSSGAIFGMIVGACMAFGETFPEHILALALFLCLYVEQLSMAPLSNITGVAYYGHIGGATCGLVLSSRLYSGNS